MATQSKHLLIVEGNHEALVHKDGHGHIWGAAEKYAACLKKIEPSLRISITRPHFANDPAPPPDYDTIDAVVFTGAGVQWSAADKDAASARNIMHIAFKIQKPVFGSCYGMQLGCVVLGGNVGANHAGPELAIARDISLLPAGENHPIYARKPSRFDALCMHRDDVFDAGNSLDVLSENAHCAIQAVASRQFVSSGKAPQFCGVQYHPELQFEDIAGFIMRSDIAGFSQEKYLEKNLHCKITSIEAVIADFQQLSVAQNINTLPQKYQLDETVLDRAIHEIELINWLNLI